MSNFNSTLYKLLGERIRQLRQDSGLSQEELSKKIGLGRASISNIEVGRHQVPLSVLYEIGKLFNKEIYEILPSAKKIDSRLVKSSQYDEILNQFLIEESTRSKIENILNNL